MVRYGAPDMKCGDGGTNHLEFCNSCEKRNRKAFSQGWSYYPGDICKHGAYVGGSGIDYMCGRCEDE